MEKGDLSHDATHYERIIYSVEEELQWACNGPYFIEIGAAI
jgi:hypothetical protein